MPVATTGSYTNGKETVAALRPVYPGGRHVFERVGLSFSSAGARPTESSKQTALQV